ncbi:hypothetical protein K7G98_29510, partial [Saccharothrix sp. MB29]|nr:hypothetical protein [Saccharothrix sp. MB29]
MPLSPAQLRLWFLDRLTGADAGYNTPVLLRLSGALDVVALRAALDDVVARHEILRTVIRDDGDPHQVVLAEARVPFAVVPDLGDLAGRPFDLSTEIPLRA